MARRSFGRRAPRPTRAQLRARIASAAFGVAFILLLSACLGVMAWVDSVPMLDPLQHDPRLFVAVALGASSFVAVMLSVIASTEA